MNKKIFNWGVKMVWSVGFFPAISNDTSERWRQKFEYIDPVSYLVAAQDLSLDILLGEWDEPVLNFPETIRMKVRELKLDAKLQKQESIEREKLRIEYENVKKKRRQRNFITREELSPANRLVHEMVPGIAAQEPGRGRIRKQIVAGMPSGI